MHLTRPPGRVAGALVGPTVRAMGWRPMSAAAAVGLVAVAVPAALTVELSVADLTRLLRLAAACGGLAVAFLLDDPAARSTQTVPTSRLVRHAVRAAVAVPAAAAWWAAVLAVTAAGAEGAARGASPLGALTLEAGAIGVAALALAACGLRAADSTGSPLAVPAVPIVLAGATLLPDRLALFVADPNHPDWSAAHDRWRLVLAVALAGAVLASRDPAPRRRGRSRPGQHVARPG